MPRRNFYLLVAILLVSFICFQRAEAQRGPYGRMFRTLVDVLDQVERNYVEPVEQRELFEGALSGITGKLDEYSGYIDPEDYQALKEDLNKTFGGIGIQVSLDNDTGQLTVMSPLVGTPAYEAGVLAGDVILKIDGRSTEGFDLHDAVALIRGQPGEALRLTVGRKGEEEPQTYRIVRAEIHVDTVLGDTRLADDSWNYLLKDDPEIGYVRITAFSEQTSQELRDVLRWLQERGMKGLIIDLRNNPGGLLRSAVEIGDMFVDQGVIVTTRGRDGQVMETFDAKAGDTFTGFPMVVLVNKYSASASEIVAACLQDHGRAVIVGERTWGKGSVQNIIPLEQHQSALRLTVASYWRPSGKNIHRGREAKEDEEWGVMPNDGCTIELKTEEFQRLMEVRRARDVVHPPGHQDIAASPEEKDEEEKDETESSKEPFVDRQFERALEVVRQAVADGTA